MLYTKANVRDNVRNRDGKRVFYLSAGDRLTEDARAWLQAQQIGILPAEVMKNVQYRLPDGDQTAEKPEHMTHLNGDALVPKDHPRIKFRGAMDLLQSRILLYQKELYHYRQPLEELLTLTRRLIRCDVLDEPVGTYSLCGLSADALRQHSHFPQHYYKTPHFMPSHRDSAVLLKLNELRTLARQTEIAAVEAFCPKGEPLRTDMIQALNRISSMLYILMIREKARSG